MNRKGRGKNGQKVNERRKKNEPFKNKVNYNIEKKKKRKCNIIIIKLWTLLNLNI